MGFFGRLFGGSGRKPPGWARDAFRDIARFDAFAAVLGEVLAARGHALGDGDLRTGSIVLDGNEWIFEEVAYKCSQADETKWRGIIDRALGGDEDDRDDDDDDDDGEKQASGPPASWVNAGKSGQRHPWIMGCQPSGGVLFECGERQVVFIVLPIVDRAALAEIEKLKTLAAAMKVCRVIVCNSGAEGHLMGTAFARACGLAHAYATDPKKPIDRGGDAGEAKAVEVRALESLKEGSLYLEQRGTAVFGTWRDGATFLCSDALSFRDLAATTPEHAIGKFLLDTEGAELVDVFLKLKKAIIPANVPGIDAKDIAEVLAKCGVEAVIVNTDAPAPAADTSRHMRVLAHIMLGDLDAADVLAVEAIAAGEQVDDMNHQRAMIALMRGNDAAADEHLAKVDTPQALTSRATIAARRGDPVAKEYALRALASLPGDPITVRIAVIAHALLGDKDKARQLLEEQGPKLDVELRMALEAAIDDPPKMFGNNFPEHAKVMFEAAKPLLDGGDFAGAEKLLRRASALDGESLEIAGELGFALSKLGRDDDAIAVYDAAIARGGTRVLLKFNRGNCQIRRRKFVEAADDFRACVDVKPDWHDARVNLISALFANADKKGARGQLDELKKLGGPPQYVSALEQMLAGTL